MPRSLFRFSGRAGLLACACSIAFQAGPAAAQQQPEIPLAPLPDKKAVPNFDPSDVYFQAWLLYKDGEKLQADKKYVDALEKYKRAQQLFDSIGTYFPTWKRNMVGGRRAKVIEVIGQVGPLALAENETKTRKIAELEGGVLTGAVEGAAPLGPAILPAPIKPAQEVETLESRRIAELEDKVKVLQEELAAKPAPAPPPPEAPKPSGADAAQREAARAHDIAKQRDIARAELKRAQDELAQLRAKYAAAPVQEELGKLTDKIESLQKDTAAMGQALGRSQEETRVAREQVAALQAERARLAQQAADLHRNLEVERKAQGDLIAAQQKQLRKYEEERRAADAKYAQAMQRIASLETQLSEVRGAYDDLRQSHDSLVRERDQMREMLKMEDGRRIEALIDQSMGLAKQLRESEETVERLRMDVTVSQNELAESMRDFAIAKGNINDLKREKAAQEKSIAELEARLRQEDKNLADNAADADPAEAEMLRDIIKKQLRIRDRQRQANQMLLDAVGEKAKEDTRIADALKLFEQAELPLSADELKLVQGHKVDDTFVSPFRRTKSEVDASVAQLEQENLPYTDAAKRAYLNERFESCRELFELVLERNPGDTEARCRLGNVLMRLDNLPEASETFRRAAELSTTNPYAHRMLGYTLLEMGDPVQAIESLKKSVELAPSNANGRVMLGRAYFEAGQEAEAEEELKSAIEFDDTMHEAHFNLAYLYAQQGKKKQGLEYYRNAVIRGAAPDMELEKSLGNRDR